MMKVLRGLLLLAGWLLSSVGFCQEFFTDDGKVAFTSDAPLREFTGTSDKLHGLIDFDKNLLDFYVDLNTLDTGVKLRDKHMRDNYLETKKYPFGEFTGNLADETTWQNLSENKPSPVVAVGMFTIHGVTKSVNIEGTLTKVGSKLQLEATFDVLLSDYNIEKPSLLGYELAEEQHVQVTALFKKSKNP